MTQNCFTALAILKYIKRDISNSIDLNYVLNKYCRNNRQCSYTFKQISFLLLS